MSISKILEDKDLSDEEKLEAVAKIVLAVRKVYGNVEENIPIGDVFTAEGTVAFIHLSQESKVACLSNRLTRIKRTVSEVLANTPGAVRSRVEEGLLSTDSMFTNINTDNGTEYL